MYFCYILLRTFKLGSLFLGILFTNAFRSWLDLAINDFGLRILDLCAKIKVILN